MGAPFSDSVVKVMPLRLLIKDALLICCIKDHFLKSGQIKGEKVICLWSVITRMMNGIYLVVNHFEFVCLS